MNITWHGTASIEIEADNRKLLIDPFIPIKGSKVPVSIEDFDGFTAILITHGHLDHLISVPQIIKRNKNLIVFCTKTPYKTLREFGVKKDNLKLIDSNGRYIINGFAVNCYKGKHAELPTNDKDTILRILKSDYRNNLPKLLTLNRICKENNEILIFEIIENGTRVLILGSLNLRNDIQYPTEVEALILPYNGLKDNYYPAVSVISTIRPKKIFLDHFDNTFPPISYDFDISPILNNSDYDIRQLELNKTVEI